MPSPGPAKDVDPGTWPTCMQLRDLGELQEKLKLVVLMIILDWSIRMGYAVHHFKTCPKCYPKGLWSSSESTIWYRKLRRIVGVHRGNVLLRLKKWAFVSAQLNEKKFKYRTPYGRGCLKLCRNVALQELDQTPLPYSLVKTTDTSDSHCKTASA